MGIPFPHTPCLSRPLAARLVTFGHSSPQLLSRGCAPGINNVLSLRIFSLSLHILYITILWKRPESVQERTAWKICTALAAFYCCYCMNISAWNVQCVTRFDFDTYVSWHFLSLYFSIVCQKYSSNRLPDLETCHIILYIVCQCNCLWLFQTHSANIVICGRLHVLK